MRNYRFKFTIALGIGAICGMLWTPVKLVHAEQQTYRKLQAAFLRQYRYYMQ